MDIFTGVKIVAAVMQLITVWALVGVAIGQRCVEKSHYQSGLAGFVSRVYSVLAVAVVIFAIDAAFTNPPELVTTVITLAVISACGYAAVAHYRVGNTMHTKLLVGAGTLFFAFVALIIGGPAWVRLGAIILLLGGMVSVTQAYLAPLPE